MEPQVYLGLRNRVECVVHHGYVDDLSKALMADQQASKSPFSKRVQHYTENQLKLLGMTCVGTENLWLKGLFIAPSFLLTKYILSQNILTSE